MSWATSSPQGVSTCTKVSEPEISASSTTPCTSTSPGHACRRSAGAHAHVSEALAVGGKGSGSTVPSLGARRRPGRVASIRFIGGSLKARATLSELGGGTPGVRAVLQQAAFVHHSGVAAQQQGLARLGGGVHHGGLPGANSWSAPRAVPRAACPSRFTRGSSSSISGAPLASAAPAPRVAAGRPTARRAGGPETSRCAGGWPVLARGRRCFSRRAASGRGDVVKHLHRGVVDELLGTPWPHCARVHRVPVTSCHPPARALGGHVQPRHDAHQARLACLGRPANTVTALLCSARLMSYSQVCAPTFADAVQRQLHEASSSALGL